MYNLKDGLDEMAIGNDITVDQFTKWIVTSPHEQVRYICRVNMYVACV